MNLGWGETGVLIAEKGVVVGWGETGLSIAEKGVSPDVTGLKETGVSIADKDIVTDWGKTGVSNAEMGISLDFLLFSLLNFVSLVVQASSELNSLRVPSLARFNNTWLLPEQWAILTTPLGSSQLRP